MEDSLLEIRDEFDNIFIFFFHKKERQYSCIQVNRCNGDFPSFLVNSSDPKEENN